ncbi:MAG: ATP-grasp domain-containing protein [Planctomycetes bacterium]|nr:ATP-grasp domain-containing protein [Planctomycetota bacterium]
MSKHFRYPSPHEQPEEAVETILAFLARNEVEVVFPVGDRVTDLVARRQDEFRRHAALALSPYDVFRRGRSKILTLQAAQRAGCPIPLTWYPAEQPLDRIAVEAPYPVLIKPDIGVGARGLTLCSSADELLGSFGAVAERFGECFVQEWVPQDGMQYKVDLIVDAERQLLSGIVYSKLRYYPATGGSSVLNCTEHRPDILDSAYRVVKELGWVGFCDFDYITDPRDGVAKLMEINPRFPESYRATVAGGLDMTRCLYQLATGRPVEPQLDYADGKYARFLLGDLLWFLTTKGDRWGAKPSFFRFFGRDMFYQLLRVSDPGPFIGYLLENVSIMLSKKGRKSRLRLDSTKPPGV